MFFFFKRKTAYEIRLSLVGSEMSIRDIPSGEASTSRMPPTEVAPVLSAIEENVVEKIEVHGRWYNLVEFAQKFCRLHPDPSGKTCK